MRAVRASAFGLFAATAALAMPLACSSSGSSSEQSACTARYDASSRQAITLRASSADSPSTEAQLAFLGFDLGRDPTLASSNGRLFYLARDMDTILSSTPSVRSLGQSST